MDDIETLLIQSVINSLDEFEGMELGDLIKQPGNEYARGVYAVGIDIDTQKKSISILLNDELTTVDRDRYLLQGWSKISQEEICTNI